MITRWVTTEPAGQWPAGVVIDLIRLTHTGGSNDPRNRDAHVWAGGDGEYLRVRSPNGYLLGMVPAGSDAGRAFIAEHVDTSRERNHQ